MGLKLLTRLIMYQLKQYINYHQAAAQVGHMRLAILYEGLIVCFKRLCALKFEIICSFLKESL